MFELATDIGQAGWHAARTAYGLAGRFGALASVYGALRARSPEEGAPRLPVLLGRGLREWAGRSPTVLVDHPLLVSALAGHGREGHGGIWYQHGELVAPRVSIVRSAARVFVPTDEVREAFVNGGVASDCVAVTGLCVEPQLARAAGAMRAARLERLANSHERTVALFSSGAEPRAHIRALSLVARSLVTHGHRALAFVRSGGAFERALLRMAHPRLVLVAFRTREDVHRETMNRFAEFDVFVSPPHERTNWAIGLGLPMALVGPDIGPFAPLNRSLLVSRGAAVELVTRRDAEAFALRLEQLRKDGTLATMNRRAQPNLSGFAAVAAAVRTLGPFEQSLRSSRPS